MIVAVCARPPPHEQLRRPLASRAGRNCPTRSPGRCEARVSGTCTRSHASRRPHAQQPAAAAVAAAIALWGSTRTTVLLPRLPSGGTVLLEPVRCSAVELARRCGAGDFAFRGRMFSERDYCDTACTHARQRANSALPCCCCSTQRANSPDPQAQEPLSLWTEVWPTQPVRTQILV